VALQAAIDTAERDSRRARPYAIDAANAGLLRSHLSGEAAHTGLRCACR